MICISNSMNILQMNNRIRCLVEANKLGFTLSYDPPGDRNRCFYQCIAKSIGVSDDEVVGMIESFLMANQVLSFTSKVLYVY